MPPIPPKAALAVALALLTAGCVAGPRVKSLGPGIPTPAPRRLLVWSLLDSTSKGATFGPDFSKPFTDQLVADLRRCGVEAALFSETGLELEDDAGWKAALAANADAVLEVKKAFGTVSQGGHLLDATLLFTLLVSVDEKVPVAETVRKHGTLKAAWVGHGMFERRGGLGIPPLSEQAAGFADEVVDRAIADGRLAGCAPIAKPKPPEDS